MMFTGSAETPSVIDINTSRNRPPMRIQNATQSGLRQPCTNLLILEVIQKASTSKQELGKV